ncbi:TonB family protein [Neptuniibacter sp. SY11_33]|uniref:TonB family protein n=1 Tax=Neptuniibacter sp. SY11_33 TaxID=3398215 RepID=UPI0039F5D355
MSTAVAQTVTAVERFGFTLFFATALHAVAILGITFTFNNERPPQKTIEITLAQYQQETAPKQADFIAQANQEGSGTSQDKLLPSTPQKAEFRDNKPRQATAIAQAIEPTPPKPEPSAAAVKAKTKSDNSTAKKTKQKVVTTKQNTKKVATKAAKQQQKAPSGGSPGTSLLARSLEMASLQAEIDAHREMRAKQPRIKRLTSASTKKREDALYLHNWRKKIENIGNLNYPEEARRNKMYGSLRLLVSIKPDGSVKTIDILESSGKPILDDAAIQIVRLAAPFQPFPVEMRKSTDILEIIRTWKFEKRAYLD